MIKQLKKNYIILNFHLNKMLKLKPLIILFKLDRKTH